MKDPREPVQWHTISAVSALPRWVTAAVLRIQAKFIRDRNSGTTGSGFLISRWTEKEFKSLIDEGGTLTYGQIGENVVAYALVTSLNEFESYHSDPKAGFFGQTTASHISEARYLYQISVDDAFHGTGIGSALLSELKKQAPKGLLTDVLHSPLSNTTSLNFLQGNAFKIIGELVLHQYRDFGELRSWVLLWQQDSI